MADDRQLDADGEVAGLEREVTSLPAASLMTDSEDTPMQDTNNDADGDLNNLFGDDAESASPDREEEVTEYRSPLRQSQSPKVAANDLVEDDEAMVEERTLEVTVPFTSHPDQSAKEVCSVRMPNFITIDAKEFNPEAFVDEAVAENDTPETTQSDRIKLRLEHTMRWRDANGKRESNSRFVQWNDGSLSLRLGNELFDVAKKPMAQEYSYLVNSLPEQGILAVHRAFTHSLTFMPTSTASLTHKRLTEAIAKRQVKSRNVQSMETTQDPEKLKREAEKAEESRLKSKRKLESQHRATRARYENAQELTADGLEIEEGGFGGRGDSYAVDDFVVDDEASDEEDERAARLQNVKRQGSDRYKNRRRPTGSDAEEEEEAEGEEEEEEEEAQFTDEEVRPDDAGTTHQKRRRVVADSDEE